MRCRQPVQPRDKSAATQPICVQVKRAERMAKTQCASGDRRDRTRLGRSEPPPRPLDVADSVHFVLIGCVPASNRRTRRHAGAGPTQQRAYVRPAWVALDSTIAFRLPRVLEVDQDDTLGRSSFRAIRLLRVACAPSGASGVGNRHIGLLPYIRTTPVWSAPRSNHLIRWIASLARGRSRLSVSFLDFVFGSPPVGV